MSQPFNLLHFLSGSVRKAFGRSAEVTVIPDGDDTPRTSENDGDVFAINAGDSTTVDGAPVLTFADDRVVLKNAGSAATTGDTATLQLDGDRDVVKNFRSGEITAEETAVQVNGTNAIILNAGEIAGGFNGVNFANGGESSGTLVNGRNGVISSDSRAVNIGGDGVRVENFGQILGTGDQRNGTVYSDATADDYTIVNARSGVIDAGEGNNGDGISLQVGDDVSGAVFNHGTVAGRGPGDAAGPIQSNGIRLFNGASEGNANFEGVIFNSGEITSESVTGPQAGLGIQNGVNFDGRVVNTGKIAGAQNGLYFGEGEHDAQVFNTGLISSDSRAVNIDGTGVTLNNYGDILGTGDQRNGTVYADNTADDYAVNNFRGGVIDAGEGNNGDGISLQVGDDVSASVVNHGTVVGRGPGDAAGPIQSNGIRLFNGASEGNANFEGRIVNTGRITSESVTGPQAGLGIQNGVNFDGRVVNTGEIAGAQNGLYFGEGEHDAQVFNTGLISSDSRAVNIDGTGVTLNNYGDILGTDNQRNGTVYADNTADDYAVNNFRGGVIDAGEGNVGDGISLQVGSDVEASVFNAGRVSGRGEPVGTIQANGIRLFDGVEDGRASFEGDIVNARGGVITSEATVGGQAAVGIQSGVDFEGRIVNQGEIFGARNGVYFASGGEHDARVENRGLIASDSRAVNIDGSGVTVNNQGYVIGTGDQRNGVIYSNSTANNFAVNNGRGGVVTLVEGASGAAVSLQLGALVTASVTNEGVLAGRGDAVGANPSAGVRLFTDLEEGSVFDGDIDNYGLISSETSAGILIDENVALEGEINNYGTIRGVVGIDASETSVGVTVNQNRGEIVGDVLLGSGDDTLRINGGEVEGLVFGGAGDDELSGGRRDDRLDGGEDNDVLTGGRGDDELSGGAGEDELDGGRGDDRLDGGSGNDALTGGRGEDTFVFTRGTAEDEVTDFEDGRDRLDVSDFGFADADEVLALARQEGDDTVIDLDADAGDRVTLLGVQLSDLDQQDLIV